MQGSEKYARKNINSFPHNVFQAVMAIKKTGILSGVGLPEFADRAEPLIEKRTAGIGTETAYRNAFIRYRGPYLPI